MSTLDRGVELQFALRDVAARALVVRHLWQVDVPLAGCEIDVIVASSASGTRRRQPGVRLSSGVLAVAGLTISGISWMHNF